MKMAGIFSKGMSLLTMLGAAIGSGVREALADHKSEAGKIPRRRNWYGKGGSDSRRGCPKLTGLRLARTIEQCHPRHLTIYGPIRRAIRAGYAIGGPVPTSKTPYLVGE